MKKIFIGWILVMLMAASFSLMGRSDAANEQNVAGDNGLFERVVDYKNGVYYFPYTKAKFGNALSAFLRVNNHVRVAAIAGDGDNGLHRGIRWNEYNQYGGTNGYFVVVELKHEECKKCGNRN